MTKVFTSFSKYIIRVWLQICLKLNYYLGNFLLYRLSKLIVGGRAFFLSYKEHFQFPLVRRHISPRDSDRRHNVNVVEKPPLINASGARTPFSLISRTHTYPLPYKACVIGTITRSSRGYGACRRYCSRRFRSDVMDRVRLKRVSILELRSRSRAALLAQAST